jgi:hypothetical protein
MKLKNGACEKCIREKNHIKMFSSENNMDPGKMPNELKNLSIVEQQLIARISPCINVHMLKHGGIAANGHCVAFPQEIDKPSKILPNLPSEINIFKVRKQGQNDTFKDSNVSRYEIQNALIWLTNNNPVYSDIIISEERLYYSQ